MNNELKAAIKAGNLTLFLGAGASKGCTSQNGAPLLDGYQLAEALAKAGGFEYQDEPLSVVYSAVRSKLQTRLDQFLESKFRHTRPSIDYLALAEYAWRRIYTLNIDDGLDKALFSKSRQKVETNLASQSVKNQDQMFERLDYIKLNGSIERLPEGLIFSASEYAKATGRALPWYEQSVVDFVTTPFLFIGTKLDEPLFKFHIERYKEVHGSAPGWSYVITPSATEIQKLDLQTYNIQHISGTLSDFVLWLKKEFSTPLTPAELAIENIPQLAELYKKTTNTRKYFALFNEVTLVRRGILSAVDPASSSNHIKPFYKGFYPTWPDILNEIPAELEILPQVISATLDTPAHLPLLAVIGPAGSGKSTLVMQAALKIADVPGWSVYYISEPPESLIATLKAIEESCGDDIRRILVVIDNIDSVANDLIEFKQTGLGRIRFLGAERENIWVSKVKRKLHRLASSPIVVRDFTENDAKHILVKLEKYGSWTRLGKLEPEQRVSELIVRARKQLLIALLEATAGTGFEEIIENDYKLLTSDDERMFMLIVGLATVNRASAPVELVNRALHEIGLLRKASELQHNLTGIVVAVKDKLSVRHPTYVNHLIERVVDPELMERAVKALMGAFARYPAPVIKHMTKKEARIYKGIINYKFLRKTLHGKRDLVLGLYKSVEKKFEHDGLFWLQYGLAHRGFHEQVQALEKLQVAFDAYPMPHTEHALAQQLLIIAPTLASETTAKEYLAEAKARLLRLDNTIDSDDIYPIVTLAEGHVKIVRRFDGEAAARDWAATYANELSARLRSLQGDAVLKGLWERLAKYSSSGEWDELPNDEMV